MNSIGYKGGLDQFPITGKAICNVLEKAFRPNDELLITDIETLCSDNCNGLGALWRSVVETGTVKIHAEHLLEILGHANQVISLSVHLAKNDLIGIVIEDGELVEIHLIE